jgi:hypothetical protein
MIIDITDNELEIFRRLLSLNMHHLREADRDDTRVYKDREILMNKIMNYQTSCLGEDVPPS